MKNSRLFSALLVVTGVFTTIYGQTAAPAPHPQGDNEYQVGAALYMQKAAEYRALSYQAYNLARRQLDADLDKKNAAKLPRAERRKPRAVVVDIDETVLDNSPAQAALISKRVPFNLNDWYAWGEMRKAKAVPGSVAFLNYAVSKGVKVFFISNRDEVQKQATMDNLTAAGFADITAANVMLRQKDEKGNNISAKGPRRAEILKKYRIVLLVGDNLDDFSDVFERKSTAERFGETDKVMNDWGKCWIMIPNAMYGTWENAIYEYKRLTEAEKKGVRARALELP